MRQLIPCLLLAAALAGCAGSSNSSPDVVEVSLEALGSGKALVEYDNAELKFKRELVDLPWELNYDLVMADVPDGTRIRIIVSRENSPSVTSQVGCSIRVNGSQIDELFTMGTAGFPARCVYWP